MTRKIVVLPESFSGPWSMGFSCPMTAYTLAGERRLAVLVTDPLTTIPPEGRELEIGHADTLNIVLERAGFTRTRPTPSVVTAPEPTPAPEPAVVVVIPEATPAIPAPEPTVTIPEPVEIPPVRAPRKKPSALSRIKSFFRR